MADGTWRVTQNACRPTVLVYTVVIDQLTKFNILRATFTKKTGLR